MRDVPEPILKRNHSKECIVKDRRNAWAFLPLEDWKDARTYKGSKSGRKHIKGAYTWFDIMCNDPSCDGLVSVCSAWILEQIQDFLLGKEKTE